MEDGSLQANIIKELRSGRREGFSLRMVPMIDVVFLLLIFFLVAAKWRPEENFLPFKLPSAQEQGYIIGKPEALMIYLISNKTGCEVRIGQFDSVKIENNRIEEGLAEIMERIRDCFIAQKRFANDPVEIICDRDVKWEYLAKVYNVLFGAGLSDITFQMTE